MEYGCVSERLVRCMTRAKKNLVMQQETITVDKAAQVLEETPPPVISDRNKLQVCLMAAELILASPSVVGHM